MLIVESEGLFRTLLLQHGKDSAALLPEDLLTIGFEFFEQTRADDARPLTKQDMGDALLFSWGTRQAIAGFYDSCFYLDLTRQFISQSGEDDDAIFQLGCMLKYPATDALREIGDGNQWCKTLEEFPAFKGIVFGHEAFIAMRGKVPTGAELYFSGV